MIVALAAHPASAMRIAYVLNTLATGGAERQIVALADRMEARGHVVAIVALRASGRG